MADARQMTRPSTLGESLTQGDGHPRTGHGQKLAAKRPLHARPDRGGVCVNTEYAVAPFFLSLHWPPIDANVATVPV